MGYVGSYVWQLRQVWGSKPLLVNGVAAFIINSQGQVLFGKRTSGNEWGFLGGSVELGDTVAQTLLKEVHEETGIVAQDYKFIGQISNPKETTLVYPNGDVAVVINNIFEVQVGDAVPVRDFEHSEFGWFDLEAELPQPFQAAGLSAVRAYRNYRKTSQIIIE